MRRILISACLMGAPVRYDGSHRRLDDDWLRTWSSEGRLVPFCPEVAGGMPTPRPAAEIVGGDGRRFLDTDPATRVVDALGRDLTAQFLAGARAALAAAISAGCEFAILMDGSPSCGSSYIYDGTFSSRRQVGVGVTTAVLNQHGVRVFNPASLDDLAEALRRST